MPRTQSSGWFLEPKRSTDFRAEVRRIVNDLHARDLLGFVPARAFYRAPAPPK